MASDRMPEEDSVGDFKPPISCSKDLPPTKICADDYVRTGLANNALSELHWNTPSPLPIMKKRRAVIHQLGFDATMFRPLRGSEKPTEHLNHVFDHADLSKADRNLSLLERMPVEIIQMIFDHVSTVDKVCLVLSCKTMMHMAPQQDFAYTEVEPPNLNMLNGTIDSDDDSVADDDSAFYSPSHVDIRECIELMARLETWMPSHLKFCFHCLMYIPRHDFDYYRAPTTLLQISYEDSGNKEEDDLKGLGVLCMACENCIDQEPGPRYLCDACITNGKKVCSDRVCEEPDGYQWGYCFGCFIYEESKKNFTDAIIEQTFSLDDLLHFFLNGI